MRNDARQTELHRPLMGVPQFSLATLLIAMALVSTLFATMVAVGPVPSLLLILFVLLIAAHVIGNAMGTSLRDHATAAYAETRPLASEPLARYAVAPSAPLVTHSSSARALRLCTALGAILGGLAGGSSLAVANWERIHAAGIALAALSSAVLSGLFVFMAGSFFTICRRALREALAHESQ